MEPRLQNPSFSRNAKDEWVYLQQVVIGAGSGGGNYLGSTDAGCLPRIPATATLLPTRLAARSTAFLPSTALSSSVQPTPAMHRPLLQCTVHSCNAQSTPPVQSGVSLDTRLAERAPLRAGRWQQRLTAAGCRTRTLRAHRGPRPPRPSRREAIGGAAGAGLREVS